MRLSITNYFPLSGTLVPFPHSTAQHSTAQHSTAQHSTAQHSLSRTSLARAFGVRVFLILTFSLPEVPCRPKKHQNETTFNENETTMYGIYITSYVFLFLIYD
jgi:hypothetical protein